MTIEIKIAKDRNYVSIELILRTVQSSYSLIRNLYFTKIHLLNYRHPFII